MKTMRNNMRREVRQLVGDDEGQAVPRFASEILNEWLYVEMEKIASIASWVNSKVSVDIEIEAGLAKYALPDNTDDVDWFIDADGNKWGTWVDELTFIQTTVPTGSAPIYTLRGNPIQLRIKPTPATDFTLTAELEIHPTMPIADRATIVIRPELKDAIVYAVAARCHQRERDFNMAEACRQMSVENIQVLRANSGDQSNDIHQLKIVR